MKPRLLVFIFSLLQYVCLAQEDKLSIDNKSLKDVIGEIESFYGVKFSYVDNLLESKTITISSENKSDLESFLANLQFQTQLRFEQVDSKYIIIRSFNENDELDICGRIVDANRKPISGVVILSENNKRGAVTDKNGEFSIQGVNIGSTISYQHISYNNREIKATKFLEPGCLRVTMLESFQVLSEFVVKEYLTTGISKRNKDIQIFPKELKILQV